MKTTYVDVCNDYWIRLHLRILFTYAVSYAVNYIMLNSHISTYAGDCIFD